jgi:hypothetical protein
VASCLRALGGHVARHMRGALRLGIQKALGVVQSHNRVDLAALASGYIVADNLDDDGAMLRRSVWTLLPLLPPTSLLMTSRRSSCRTLLLLGPSSPETSWALGPLGCSQKSSRAALCNLIYFVFISLCYSIPFL